MGFLILVLLFSFSRSECPCPKSHTGRDAFDPEVHWRTEDFDITFPVEGRRAMKVRFRSVKQDQRVERPEASGDGDWAILGDIPDSLFSIVAWYLKVVALAGAPRDPASAMFVDEQGRPLVYYKALKLFHEFQLRVGVPEADLAGLHGLRVAGYNGVVNTLGEDLAVAHGLWKSSAHKRYARFQMSKVIRIPAAIVEEDEEEELGVEDGAEREAGPPAERLRRDDLAPGVQQSPGGPQARRGPRASPVKKLSYEERVARSLPPGWRQVMIRSKYNTTYKRYVGPQGRRAQSIREAWRLHGSQRVVDSGSDAVDSGDMESGYTGSGDEEVQEGDGEEEPEVVPAPSVRSVAEAGPSSDGSTEVNRYWLQEPRRKPPVTRASSRQGSRAASPARSPVHE